LARILYVDDEEFWRDYITRNLRGHHVDVADSLPAAIDLLESGLPYAVALVDLNLHDDGDSEGGELLDLLCLQYPETKRVVVTGSPPGGDIGKRILEPYDARALIIKAKLQLPDLRRVVEEAIAVQPGALPHELRLNRWNLRQRFRDWHRIQSERLDQELRAAEGYLENAGKLAGRGETRQQAQEAVVSARQRRAGFRELSARLREEIFSINSEADLDAALESLEKAEDQFSEDAEGCGQP
jgi:CheY-like chemotaxis protein